MTIPLFDSHCHLDYIVRESGESPEAVLGRAALEGVTGLINPAVTPARFQEVLDLAARFPNVYAAIAVHPCNIDDLGNIEDLDGQSDCWLQVEAAASHPKVKAIGETGLDYYWDQSRKAEQQACFDRFLKLALKRDLPVIIHDRDAHEDIYALVQANPGVRGVMHCFSGDGTFARQMMDLGFYISFAGNVTFKKAVILQEAAQQVPLDRLLIETDSPFLSPVPFRGKPNEPARVRYVCEMIATLKGLSPAVVAEATAQNAQALFKLDA